jgi:hypothetical protein
MTDHNELIAYVLDEPEQAAREIARLRNVEAIALRVASSRRNGIVTDKGVLDLLDAVLEAQPVTGSDAS